jgi:eukaryotic-like serine/threonine-protein kinase
MPSFPSRGQILGHYRILDQIGAGGVGIVFQAHDERLDRDVALKVLPAGALAEEHARRHFRQEALALAKLNHPSIATIHDFDTQDGIDFLVMEYVPGITLADKLRAGALSEKEILAIAEQIAKALDRAHHIGIVHRDLKPGNIMITSTGEVKVLDFGLSLLLKPANEAALAETITIPLRPIGTLPYMAPEQLRGEPLDARCDIYAVGVVLYEMTTGRRPFDAPVSTGLIEEILHKPVVPPQVINSRISQGLANIILKCLERDPENRYQSAKEIVVDFHRTTADTFHTPLPKTLPTVQWHRMHSVLVVAVIFFLALAAALTLVRRWAANARGAIASGPAATHVSSLAVLPLDNLSANPTQEYFTDGMTEELISALAKISSLRVISRTSVMQYKGVHKPLPEVAHELHVQAIVTGAVSRSADSKRVRITVELVDAATDSNLWSQSYDRYLGDVFALQDDVARDIALQIRVQLTPQEQERLTSSRRVNLEAHDAYLKGRYYWNKRTPDSLNKSLYYFQQALEKDPRYALAYVGLADSYALASQWGHSPREANERSKVAAMKALEIDSTLAEAHTSLAAAMWNLWDWNTAEKEFKHAIELNPNYATAHQWFSSYLSTKRDPAGAIREARRALELDPLSLIINANLGGVLFDAHRYDEALQQCRKTIELEANFAVAHDCIGMVYVQMKKFSDAIPELRRAVLLSGSPLSLGELGYAYAVSGYKSRARSILYELKHPTKGTYVAPYPIAAVYAGLGEKKEALTWLRKAYADRGVELLWLQVDPMLDSLRSDPGFQDLVYGVGFPKAQS